MLLAQLSRAHLEEYFRLRPFPVLLMVRQLRLACISIKRPTPQAAFSFLLTKNRHLLRLQLKRSTYPRVSLLCISHRKVLRHSPCLAAPVALHRSRSSISFRLCFRHVVFPRSLWCLRSSNRCSFNRGNQRHKTSASLKLILFFPRRLIRRLCTIQQAL